ncbi:hypothetical protein [Gluconobacter sp. OJB]|uniref:hypothetical protein n=1 Tax=Gluconobacter sp. OJB TaxID=3145196 RepID=UPI0031F87494
MIFQILKLTAVFVLGFATGKVVECAQWELTLKRYQADFVMGMRSNSTGGRPRKGETAEQARARREGAA